MDGVGGQDGLGSDGTFDDLFGGDVNFDLESMDLSGLEIPSGELDDLFGPPGPAEQRAADIFARAQGATQQERESTSEAQETKTINFKVLSAFDPLSDMQDVELGNLELLGTVADLGKQVLVGEKSQTSPDDLLKMLTTFPLPAVEQGDQQSAGLSEGVSRSTKIDSSAGSAVDALYWVLEKLEAQGFNKIGLFEIEDDQSEQPSERSGVVSGKDLKKLLRTDMDLMRRVREGSVIPLDLESKQAITPASRQLDAQAQLRRSGMNDFTLLVVDDKEWEAFADKLAEYLVSIRDEAVEEESKSPSETEGTTARSSQAVNQSSEGVQEKERPRLQARRGANTQQEETKKYLQAVRRYDDKTRDQEESIKRGKRVKESEVSKYEGRQRRRKRQG